MIGVANLVPGVLNVAAASPGYDVPSGPYQPFIRDVPFQGKEGEAQFYSQKLSDALDLQARLANGTADKFLGRTWTKVNVIQASSGKGWYVLVDFTRPDKGELY